MRQLPCPCSAGRGVEVTYRDLAATGPSGASVTKTQRTRGTCKSKHGADLTRSAGLPRPSIHVRPTVRSSDMRHPPEFCSLVGNARSCGRSLPRESVNCCSQLVCAEQPRSGCLHLLIGILYDPSRPVRVPQPGAGHPSFHVTAGALRYFAATATLGWCQRRVYRVWGARDHTSRTSPCTPVKLALGRKGKQFRFSRRQKLWVIESRRTPANSAQR